MAIERLSSQSITSKIESLYSSNQTKNNSTEKNEDQINPNGHKPKEAKPITKDKMNEVIDGMNKFLQPTHTSLKFELHEKLQEYYVKIVDDNTHEVIREIPSKKLLDIYAAMTEYLGLFVDKKI